MTTAVPGLADLPGPTAHVRVVLDSLTAGQCCLWLLPDPIVECGDADALVRSVQARLAERRIESSVVVVSSGVNAPVALPRRSSRPIGRDTAELGSHWSVRADLVSVASREATTRGAPAGTVGAAASSVLEQPRPQRYPGIRLPGFGRGSVSARREDELSWQGTSPLFDRLAPSQPLEAEEHSDPLAVLASRAAVVIVRAWLEPFAHEVASLARRFPSQAGLTVAGSPSEGGRVLIVARVGDLSPGLIAELERDPATDVRWWWGVLGRADTSAIVLNRTAVADNGRDRLRQKVRVESIVELTGPDLPLAMDLAESWSGSRTDLEHALRAHHAGRLPTRRGALFYAAPGTRRPPARLVDDWADGAVELWDEGFCRASLYHLDVASLAVEIDRRLWAAQVRALLPTVEAMRQSLLAELLEAGADPATAAMELGPMRHQVATGGLLMTRHQEQRLKALLHCRNALAHNKAVSDAALGRVYAALI